MVAVGFVEGFIFQEAGGVMTSPNGLGLGAGETVYFSRTRMCLISIGPLVYASI